ncbi:MAG: hypothetical protein ACPG1C_08700 [Alphaproteobacteria bacterium]
MVSFDHLSDQNPTVADYSPAARQFENGAFAAAEIKALQSDFKNSINKSLLEQFEHWHETLQSFPTPHDIGRGRRQLPSEILGAAPVYAALAMDRSYLPEGARCIGRLFALALVFEFSRPKFKISEKGFKKRAKHAAHGSLVIGSELFEHAWQAIKPHCENGEWGRASERLVDVKLDRARSFEAIRRSNLRGPHQSAFQAYRKEFEKELQALEDIQRLLSLFQKNRLPGFERSHSKVVGHEKRLIEPVDVVLSTSGHNLRLEKRFSANPKDVLRPQHRTKLSQYFGKACEDEDPLRTGAANLWACVALTSHGFDHLLQSLLPAPFADNPHRLVSLELSDGNVIAHIKMRDGLKLAKIKEFGDRASNQLLLELPQSLHSPLSRLKDHLGGMKDMEALQPALNAIFLEKDKIRDELRALTNKHFNETRLRNTMVHGMFHLNQDIALAFLLSGERLETSDAALNYITWSTHQVNFMWRDTAQRLYGPVIEFPKMSVADMPIGSQIASVLTNNNPKAGSRLPHRPKLKPGPKQPDQLIERLNVLALEAAQAFLIATTHRGSAQFTAITAGDISLHRRMALIADKRVDLGLFRRIVFFNETTAVRLVRYHLALKSILERLDNDEALAQALGKREKECIRAAIDGTGPLFLHIKLAKKTASIRPVDAKEVWSSQLRRQYDDPKLARAETHRHIYSTKMREFGCPPLLIEASMGHQAGPVFIGAGGLASPSEFLSELEPHLDQLFEWHGIKPECFEEAEVSECWLAPEVLGSLTSGPDHHKAILQADLYRMVDRIGGPYDGTRRTAPQAVEEVLRVLLQDDTLTLGSLPDTADLGAHTIPEAGKEKTIVPIREAKPLLIRMCGHDLALLKRSILLFRQTLNKIEAEKNKGHPKENLPWKITRPHHQHWVIGEPEQFTSGRFQAEAQARHIRQHLLNNIDMAALTEAELAAYLVASLICFAPIEDLNHLDRVLIALVGAKRMAEIDGVLIETVIETEAGDGLEPIKEAFLLTGPALLSFCHMKCDGIEIPNSAKPYSAKIVKLLPKSFQSSNASTILRELMEVFALNRLFEAPGLLVDPLEGRGNTRDLSLERYIAIKTDTPITTSQALTDQLAALNASAPRAQQAQNPAKPNSLLIAEMDQILKKKLVSGQPNLAMQRIDDFHRLINSGILTPHNERIAKWLISLCHDTANRRKLNEPIDDGTVQAYFQRGRLLFDELQELEDDDWPAIELSEHINHCLESHDLAKGTKEGYVNAINRFCRDNHLPRLHLNKGEAITPKAAIRAEFMSDQEIDLVAKLLKAHSAPLAPICKTFSSEHQAKSLFRLSALYGARRGELLGLEWRDLWEFSEASYLHIHNNKRRSLKTENGVRILAIHEAATEMDQGRFTHSDLMFKSLSEHGASALKRMGDLIRAVSSTEHMRLHSNRHGIGSKRYNACFGAQNSLSERAIALETLAHELGHGAPQTTRDFYGHMNSELMGRYTPSFEAISLTRIAELSGVNRPTVNKFASRFNADEATSTWNQQLARWADLPKISPAKRRFSRLVKIYGHEIAERKPKGAKIARLVVRATEVGIVQAAGEQGIHQDQLLCILSHLKSHNAEHNWQWISPTALDQLHDALTSDRTKPSLELLELGRLKAIDREHLTQWKAELENVDWNSKAAGLIAASIMPETWHYGTAPVTLNASYHGVVHASTELRLPFSLQRANDGKVALSLPPPHQTQRKARTMIKMVLLAIQLANLLDQ